MGCRRAVVGLIDGSVAVLRGHLTPACCGTSTVKGDTPERRRLPGQHSRTSTTAVPLEREIDPISETTPGVSRRRSSLRGHLEPAAACPNCRYRGNFAWSALAQIRGRCPGNEQYVKGAGTQVLSIRRADTAGREVLLGQIIRIRVASAFPQRQLNPMSGAAPGVSRLFASSLGSSGCRSCEQVAREARRHTADEARHREAGEAWRHAARHGVAQQFRALDAPDCSHAPTCPHSVKLQRARSVQGRSSLAWTRRRWACPSRFFAAAPCAPATPTTRSVGFAVAEPGRRSEGAAICRWTVDDRWTAGFGMSC